MAAAILGTRRQGRPSSLGGLGRLERDARQEAQEKARTKARNLLGGAGIPQNPTRRVAPLEGLGR